MSVTGTRTCQNCRQNFVIEPEDFLFYEKVKVPAPTFCVECRNQRRFAFRNERSLYRRKCDLCGQVVIGRVSQDKPYSMYCQKCWWSDQWDPLSFGQEYDFSKPFFAQFRELLRRVPHVSLLNSNMVNSEWVNQETDDKNCYLNTGGHFNENSAYNTYEVHGKDSFDNYWLIQSELCYEDINCDRCYKTFFSQECIECRETMFSYDCRNCTNIFGCAGLRNKKYYIFNKPYTKEEYHDFMKKNPIRSHGVLEEMKRTAEEVWRSMPHRDRFILKSINSSGNFIVESKNAKNCWNVERMEDCKNMYIAVDMKDSYDGSSIGWGELIYESAHSGGFYGSKFCAYIFGAAARVDAVNSSHLEYCIATPSSNHCFGCVNFQKKEYCILNKQYSKSEYELLLPKIKAHMQEMPYVDKKGRTYSYGEFFPVELSPFAYNETIAQDFYPLSKEEARAAGYEWIEAEGIAHQFSDYEIPDDTNDVGDDILAKVLKCEISGKAYRIIPMELAFYRRVGLPIPRLSPAERHKRRINRLLPKRIFERQCECGGKVSTRGSYQNVDMHFHGFDRCPNAIETSYAPDRPEIVYCEQCYQAEVV